MPGPGVPASECLRGIPATADPHAPRAAPLAASPALRPLPKSPSLYLPPSSARASCHQGARQASRPHPLSPIGPPTIAPPPGPRIAPTARLLDATPGLYALSAGSRRGHQVSGQPRLGG